MDREAEIIARLDELYLEYDRHQHDGTNLAPITQEIEKLNDALHELRTMGVKLPPNQKVIPQRSAKEWFAHIRDRIK